MLCGQYNNEEDNRLTKIKSLENGVEGKKNIKFNLKFKFKKNENQQLLPLMGYRTRIRVYTRKFVRERNLFKYSKDEGKKNIILNELFVIISNTFPPP